MTSPHGWFVRIRDLFGGRRVDRDVDTEIAAHLQNQIDEYVAAGMAPQQARRQALLEFGNLDDVREQHRDLRRWALLESVARDLRFAGRLFRRNPGFTALAVASLALGIGANTVIFSGLRAILFEPLPYPDPDRLVTVRMAPPQSPTETEPLPVPLFTLLRDRSQQFEAVGGYDSMWSANLGPNGGVGAERLNGHRASPELFTLLGVVPALGRLYTVEENLAGSSPTVVLSHEVWTHRFAADPAVVGRAVQLDGVATTVIGVMPPGFSVLDAYSDFWMPFRLGDANLRGAARWIYTVGRLRPGATAASTAAEVESIFAEYRRTFPDRTQDWHTSVQPLHDYFFGAFRKPLFAIQGAVALVLLIACANLATLLLARAPARQREMAVRGALGETRGGMIRQLMVESVALSALGGAAGATLAAVTIPILAALSPDWLPRAGAIALDVNVLVITFAVSLATALLFGSLPALHGSRVDLAPALKAAGGRGATSARARTRQLGALVATQIALAFVLLTGAGLMVHSFVQLIRTDLGADPDRVLSLQVRLPFATYTRDVSEPGGVALREHSPRIPLFYEQALEALRAIPGVTSASGINVPPFTFFATAAVALDDNRMAWGDDAVSYYWVTDGYFETMHTSLVAGRSIAASDSEHAPWVVVINDTMRQRFWPDADPVGRHLTFPHQGVTEPPRQIVGVVRDMKTDLARADTRPTVFIPHRQQLPTHGSWQGPWRTRMTFVLRTTLDQAAATAAARAAVASADPSHPIFDVRPVEAYIDDQVRSPRYIAVLLAGLAGVALVLGMVGIYGVTAHTVALRTQEFGIRRALGADGRSVLLLALRQSAMVVTIGLLGGLAAALAATRFIAAFVPNLSATDPWMFAAVLALLGVTGFVATMIPAWRAVKVDPLSVLRAD